MYTETKREREIKKKKEENTYCCYKPTSVCHHLYVPDTTGYYYCVHL